MASSPEELQLERLRLALEEKRLQLEELREARESRFFTRHMGSIITLVVSVSAAFLSYQQFRSTAAQQELTESLNRAQQAQELNLKVLDFVSRNYKLIFPSSEDTASRLRDILLVTLPARVGARLFAKLEQTATNADDVRVWNAARLEAQALTKKQTSNAPAAPAPAARRVFLHYQDERDLSLVESIGAALRSSGYQVPGYQHVTQNTDGDVRYYHQDELDMAEDVRTRVDQVLAHAGRPALSVLLPVFKIGAFRNMDLPRGVLEVWIPRRHA